MAVGDKYTDEEVAAFPQPSQPTGKRYSAEEVAALDAQQPPPVKPMAETGYIEEAVKAFKNQFLGAAASDVEFGGAVADTLGMQGTREKAEAKAKELRASAEANQTEFGKKDLELMDWVKNPVRGAAYGIGQIAGGIAEFAPKAALVGAAIKAAPIAVGGKLAAGLAAMISAIPTETGEAYTQLRDETGKRSLAQASVGGIPAAALEGGLAFIPGVGKVADKLLGRAAKVVGKEMSREVADKLAAAGLKTYAWSGLKGAGIGIGEEYAQEFAQTLLEKWPTKMETGQQWGAEDFAEAHQAGLRGALGGQFGAVGGVIDTASDKATAKGVIAKEGALAKAMTFEKPPEEGPAVSAEEANALPQDMADRIMSSEGGWAETGGPQGAIALAGTVAPATPLTAAQQGGTAPTTNAASLASTIGKAVDNIINPPAPPKTEEQLKVEAKQQEADIKAKEQQDKIAAQAQEQQQKQAHQSALVEILRQKAELKAEEDARKAQQEQEKLAQSEAAATVGAQKVDTDLSKLAVDHAKAQAQENKAAVAEGRDPVEIPMPDIVQNAMNNPNDTRVPGAEDVTAQKPMDQRAAKVAAMRTDTLEQVSAKRAAILELATEANIKGDEAAADTLARMDQEAAAIETAAKPFSVAATKTVKAKESANGYSYVLVTMANGDVVALTKMDSASAMGLPGWHVDVTRMEKGTKGRYQWKNAQPGIPEPTYLGESKAEAVKNLPTFMAQHYTRKTALPTAEKVAKLRAGAKTGLPTAAPVAEAAAPPPAPAGEVAATPTAEAPPPAPAEGVAPAEAAPTVAKTETVEPVSPKMKSIDAGLAQSQAFRDQKIPPSKAKVITYANSLFKQGIIDEYAMEEIRAAKDFEEATYSLDGVLELAKSNLKDEEANNARGTTRQAGAERTAAGQQQRAAVAGRVGAANQQEQGAQGREPVQSEERVKFERAKEESVNTLKETAKRFPGRSREITKRLKMAEGLAMAEGYKPTRTQQVFVEIANRIGIKVIWIKPNKFTNGLFSESSPETIFVATNSRFSAGRIIMHEIKHSMDFTARTNEKVRDVVRQVNNAIFESIPNSEKHFQEWLVGYARDQRTSPSQIDRDIAIEEYLAEVFQDAAANQTFWNRLREAHPAVYQAAMRTLRAVVQAIYNMRYGASLLDATLGEEVVKTIMYEGQEGDVHVGLEAERFSAVADAIAQMADLHAKGEAGSIIDEKALKTKEPDITLHGTERARFSQAAFEFTDNEDDQVLVDEKRGVATARFSTRTLEAAEEEGYYEEQMNRMVEAGIATRKEANKFLKDIRTIAAMIHENEDFLQYDAVGSEVYQALKDNADAQYGKSLDFTTVCRKTAKLFATVSDIMAKNQKGLTSDQVWQIRDELLQAGEQVNCAACYVFSRWVNMGKILDEMARKFPTLPKELIYDPRRRHELASRTETAVIWRQNKKTGETKRVEMTPLQWLKARGSGAGKSIETRTEYRPGEIQEWFNAKRVRVQNLFSGMRMQSWSDFDPLHVIDLVQAVSDMAAAGLAAHAYTKVADFVELIAPAGGAVNMSLIPKGTGVENGRLVFDKVEGMDPDVAFMLRMKHRMAGTETIGSNDEMIRLAMADPRIDYIIPYHASGLKKAFQKKAGMIGWTDYTKVQSDEIVDKEKFAARVERIKAETGMTEQQAHKIMPWEYWDPNLSGDENAQRFLEYARENGVKPRFSNFLNEDGTAPPGFWKLLIDRKMYDAKGRYIEQKPMTLNVNMDVVNNVFQRAVSGEERANDLNAPDETTVERWTQPVKPMMAPAVTTREASAQRTAARLEKDGGLYTGKPVGIYFLGADHVHVDRDGNPAPTGIKFPEHFAAFSLKTGGATAVAEKAKEGYSVVAIVGYKNLKESMIRNPLFHAALEREFVAVHGKETATQIFAAAQEEFDSRHAEAEKRVAQINDEIKRLKNMGAKKDSPEMQVLIRAKRNVNFPNSVEQIAVGMQPTGSGRVQMQKVAEKIAQPDWQSQLGKIVGVGRFKELRDAQMDDVYPTEVVFENYIKFEKPLDYEKIVNTSEKKASHKGSAAWIMLQNAVMVMHKDEHPILPDIIQASGGSKAAMARLTKQTMFAAAQRTGAALPGPAGKSAGGTLYVDINTINTNRSLATEKQKALYNTARERVPADFQHDAVGIEPNGNVRFLKFNDLTQPHPWIEDSFLVKPDGSTGRGLTRGQIYHRMDQVLSPDHPMHPFYAAVTKIEEEAGALGPFPEGAPGGKYPSGSMKIWRQQVDQYAKISFGDLNQKLAFLQAAAKPTNFEYREKAAGKTESEAAGATARPWKMTTTYRQALDNVIKTGDKVVDYGSGPYQNVKPHVEGKGATYTAFDRFGGIGSLEDIKDADVVMGSNVLNTAVYAENPERAYNDALNEMADAMKGTATLVVNMPTSGPMAKWMTPARLEADLKQMFTNVTRKGEVMTAQGRRYNALRGGEQIPVRFMTRAGHASRHLMTGKKDMTRAHRGKGQGAETFGAGLYFWTSQSVGNSYYQEFMTPTLVWDSNSNPVMFSNGKPVTAWNFREIEGKVYSTSDSERASINPRDIALGMLFNNGLNVTDTARSMRRNRDEQRVKLAMDIASISGDERLQGMRKDVEDALRNTFYGGGRTGVKITAEDRSRMEERFYNEAIQLFDKAMARLDPEYDGDTILTLKYLRAEVELFDRSARELVNLNNELVGAKLKQISYQYEAELDFDAEDILDFDRPLKDQSPKVLDLIKKLTRAAEIKFIPKGLRWEMTYKTIDHRGNEAMHTREVGEAQRQDLTEKMRELNSGSLDKTMTGADLYWFLSGLTGDNALASDMLLAAGIPAHRYMDGDSRTKYLETRREMEETRKALRETEDELKTTDLDDLGIREGLETERERLASELYELEKSLDDGTITYNHVVYDDSKITLSARESDGVVTRFASAQRTGAKITPEQDRAYMAAVEKGDTATAQRMVDEAAKKAGYTVGPVWHGTTSEDENFTVFKPHHDFERTTLGFHFGTKEQAAYRIRDLENRDKGLRRFWLKAEAPMRMHDLNGWEPLDMAHELHRMGYMDNQEFNSALATDQKAKTAEDIQRAYQDHIIPVFERLGRDSVVYKNDTEGPGDSYMVFSPNQIKSADPVARGADGNVIPLSGRFNEAKDDIRFASFSRRGAKQPTLTQPKSVWDMTEKGRMTDLIRNYQNRMVDVKDLTNAIRKAIGVDIPENADIDQQQKTYLSQLRDALRQAEEYGWKPILEAMAGQKINIDEMGEYLKMRRVEEYNDLIAQRNPDLQGPGSGIETAVARKYLASIPAARKAELDKVANMVDSFVKDTHRLLVGYGLEKQEVIDAWEKDHPHWVSFERVLEDGETSVDAYGFGGDGTGQGFNVKGSVGKIAHGSPLPINNASAFASIISARERALKRGIKNVTVGHATYAAAMQYPNAKFWRAIKPTDVRTAADLAALKTQLEQTFGIAPAEVDNLFSEPKQAQFNSRTKLTEYRINPGARAGDHVFVTRINGEDHFVFFNKRDERSMATVRALKNNDIDPMLDELAFSALITRYYASVSTQWNPFFGVKNFGRDMLEAGITLKATPLAGKQLSVWANAFKALPALWNVERGLRGLQQINMANPLTAKYQQYKKAGGPTGHLDYFNGNMERANGLAKELEFLRGEGKKIGNLKVPQAGWTAFRYVFGFIEDMNTALENATRFAAFNVAMQEGMTESKAAVLAKELTVNFNDKGRKSANMNALWAFANAAIQGTATVARTMFDTEIVTDAQGRKINKTTLSKTGKQIVAGGFALGVMQALMLGMSGARDDDPPDWDKDNNFYIPNGTAHPIKIPTPLGFNFLINMGRRMAEMAMTGGDRAGEKFGGLLAAMLNAHNPLGDIQNPGLMATPTPLKPVMSAWANVDWKNMPIYREDFNKLDPTPGFTRARDTASWTGKQIAVMLDFITGGDGTRPGFMSPTPDMIDFLTASVAGGLGREMMKIGSVTEMVREGQDVPTYKIPLVGTYVGQRGGMSWERSRYYDNIKEAHLNANTIKNLAEAGEDVGLYLEEHPEAALSKAALRVEGKIKKLHTLRGNAKGRGDKETVGRAEEAMNGMMMELNRLIAEAKGERT